MKKYIFNILEFCFFSFVIILLIVFFMPNYNIYDNLLYANKDKQNRLQNLSSPKIIFIGGSNVSFGVNSKMIQDSLKMPVVNMAIHGNLGADFMMEEIKPFVNRGDIVVFIPDYTQFAGNVSKGNIELVALMIDGNPSSKQFIPFKQRISLLSKFLEYGITKIKLPTIFILDKLTGQTSGSGPYKRSSFNEYGDVRTEWLENKQEYIPLKDNSIDKLNSKFFNELEEFKNYITDKNASLLILPPTLDNTSYNAVKNKINEISSWINKDKLSLDYSPQEFIYQDSLFYDFPFHLNRKAVDNNTRKIIRKIRAN
ncbi:MAG: hypothetical protein Q4F97_07265 [Bacteroidales bacterium]|nr:hypothetical protein [Bacteroidales bacterium]